MNINYLTTCYPDNFQGSPNLVLNVSAYPSQTYEMLVVDILEALECTDFGQWEKITNDVDYEKIIEDYVNRPLANGDINDLCNKGLNLPEDYEGYHYYELTFED